MGPFGVGGGGLVDGGDRLHEKVVPAEAAVAFTALRIEDPEGRPPPRRAVSIARDQRLRPLPDDVVSEADPRPPGKFEAEPARLGDGAGHRAGEPGWLEDDEERLRPTGEGGQPAQPVGDLVRPVRLREAAARQVEEQQVDRSAGEEAPGDGQTFIEGLGRDDHEPFEPDAARDGLDRVERPGEIEPGDDPTGDLRLRDQPERERGPAARAVAADGDAGRSGQAAGTEDRIEAGEPGGDDPLVRAGNVAGLVLRP